MKRRILFTTLAADRISSAIRSAEATHCKHGHEFTVQNTYVRSGFRRCRQCALIKRRKLAGWPKHLLELPAQKHGWRPA